MRENTVQEFVIGLSVISRGSLDEKMCWIFHLYDTDHDGILTRYDVQVRDACKIEE